jgi:hypothetical protein
VRRARRLAFLAAVAVILLVTLVLTAFGSTSQLAVRPNVPAPSVRLLPPGPPTPQLVARYGAVRLLLPVPQHSLTAIAYHAPGDGALALQPVGSQKNRGLLSRLFHGLFGGSHSKLSYYQLSGGDGTPTGALDLGAAPGVDVYAPTDGVVVGIAANILSGKRYGVSVDLQPTANPGLVVSVSPVQPSSKLSVGAPVIAGSTKLGSVVDVSGVEHQALSRYTQDAGNHVTVEVHPSSTLALR